MKNIVFFILLFGVLHLTAQENIEVKMTELAIDSVMQPAFIIEIPQAESKDAITMWEDQLVPHDLFDTFKKLPKMEKEDKDKWYIQGVVIDAVSPDTLSVFTRISTMKDRISFAALFKSEKGFIGSNPSDASLNERTCAYLRTFAIEVYKQAVQDELDGLEKGLKKMENDYSGYEKDNRKLDRKSTESQSNLSTLEKTPLNTNSTGTSSEEQMKEIKKEEKALKKYSKQIDKNENKQDKLAREIEKKKEEIKEVQQKLKNIK